VSYLTKVASGTISLGAGDPDGTPKPSEAPRMSGGDKVFGRDRMRGF